MANRVRLFLWCLLLPLLRHGGQVLSPLPVRVLPYDQCERPTGSRTVHFARHGQAEHNVALAQGRSAPQHVDSRLTKCGEEQAAGIARTLEKDADWPDIVLTSPLRRCLRTALLAFRPKVGCVLALEELRELVSASPHNSRRPVEELKMEFPQVDFSRISTTHDGVWHQDMDRESRQSCAKRARRFLRRIHAEEPICSAAKLAASLDGSMGGHGSFKGPGPVGRPGANPILTYPKDAPLFERNFRTWWSQGELRSVALQPTWSSS
ncbi:PGM [Symbiodinium sp. CCMP2592]|nr:PGM [Symbiodinium sp. CCMP2592]